jgi:hypothetical protein
MVSGEKPNRSRGLPIDLLDKMIADTDLRRKALARGGFPIIG